MVVEQHVGRLAEVRFADPLDLDQLSAFMAHVRSLVEASPRPLVFCTDWRKVSLFDKDVSESVIWIMRRDNPRIGANGILVDDERLLKQAEAIVTEAHNSRRKVFLSVAPLREWLDSLLLPPEQERLSRFLAGEPAP
jgi:hypothetical protein